MKEINLVQKAIDGDSDAFGQLFEKYYEKVKNVLKKYSSSQDADDLTAETFTRAFEKISQLKSPEAFVSWLIRIGLRLLINDSRRLEKKIGPFATDFFIIQNTLLTEEVVKYHNPLLDSEIKESYKEILDMWYIKEMTVKEISDTLGIKPNAVNQRVYVARNALKEELKDKKLEDFEKDF